MTNYKFTNFKVLKYRSLINVDIPIGHNSPTVICGENNIGKTNFLRALNVYFNSDESNTLFVPSIDLPHHIFHGSRGKGLWSEFIGTFEVGGVKNIVSIKFDGIEGLKEYKINDVKVNKHEVDDILTKFRFMFIESNNINLPMLMSNLLEEDGLNALDGKRSKQVKALKKLQEFIFLSQEAISDIEKDINEHFKELTDFDGILKGKNIKIEFAEYEKLRDIVKNMTSITLFDGNNSSIASKGSGAQRAVFIAMMKYVAKKSKQNVIWGIDEPEVFLQPRLQKRFHSTIKDIVSNQFQPVILTTHSQHFIELNSLNNTHLFKGDIVEKNYARKLDKVFYETNTKPIETQSNFEKSTLIREHLGINNNDGWEVLPYNIVVEGEEDKKYLEVLFKVMGYPYPNIIWSGGASKIAGYLQYYEIFAKDLDYKPYFHCIFDNDTEGRDQKNRISPNKYKYISVSTVILPHSDGRKEDKRNDWEIEDILPIKSLVDIVNKIVRKERYKIIKIKQISDKNMPAHLNTQLLKYLENCLSTNNPESPPFLLDDEGRKRQICKLFCENDILQSEITDPIKEFITNLRRQ
jgi:predicted ATP-dependent endonuclease of OLD family